MANFSKVGTHSLRIPAAVSMKSPEIQIQLQLRQGPMVEETRRV